jgi:hypothetical protein
MEMPCSTETSLIFSYNTESYENLKGTNLNFVTIIIIRPDEIITAPAVPC